MLQNAVMVQFLEHSFFEKCSIDVNVYMEREKERFEASGLDIFRTKCIVYVPNFKSLGNQELRLFAVKCCKNAIFCTFLNVAAPTNVALT